MCDVYAYMTAHVYISTCHVCIHECVNICTCSWVCVLIWMYASEHMPLLYALCMHMCGSMGEVCTCVHVRAHVPVCVCWCGLWVVGL